LKLLISVRGPAEVAAALRGGAEIIDAKDPSRGALGAMDRATLAQVLSEVPSSMPCSAALGDPRDPGEAAALVAGLPFPARAAPSYVKLGFGRQRDQNLVERILAAAVTAAGRHPAKPRVIAVVYADEALGLGLSDTLAVAVRARANGLLADTLRKDGGSLLETVSRLQLDVWIAEARSRGLLVGLAGRLGPAEVALLADSAADVLGVRGAACDGGRCGSVNAGKVRALRDLLRVGAEECQQVAKHQRPGPRAARATPGK
jgi:uncharacterized protein (UPF0264 family)